MSNLITKIDDSDVGKFKTVPVDFKNLSDVIDNEVAKNRLQHADSLEKKIPDETTLIHTNQYKRDK